MGLASVVRIAAVIAALAVPASAAAYVPAQPWPPAQGPGSLFVHYGEEHWNDDDGETLLPKVVEESVRYRPAMVTMSGDKANDGTRDQLERWREIMTPYDQAGIPYFAGVGNHDRDSASPGLPPPGPLDNYMEVFKERPYPMGDGPPPADAAISPRERPASDPAGAASHYFVDYGAVRWVFIDNSCFQIDECDLFQEPSAQTRGGEGQFAFMRRVAREATDAGKVVFVVMHMPTRDPADQSYRDAQAINHVMGKGVTTNDNQEFEQVARETGVDGVFLGHIKGQFQYKGEGDVPYFIDGGAGGELYTDGPVGTDHGYWHGFRLVRVDGGAITTDTVPIFVPDSIRIEGPDRVARGESVHLFGFGRQPVFNDPAKVEALELRDPDPRPRSGSSLSGIGQWALLPGVLLLLLGLAARTNLAARGGLVAVLAIGGFAAVSVAQQEEPTSTPKDALPTPARIWTSADPSILRPVASHDDDPRRDAASQTDSGVFRAICPGTTYVELASGFEAQRKRVTSVSASGPIVRRLARRARTIDRGSRKAVAAVRLNQPARVVARVRKGRRFVRTLTTSCVTRARSIAWDGRIESRGRPRRGRPGLYTIDVRVRSDRKVALRRYRVRLR